MKNGFFGKKAIIIQVLISTMIIVSYLSSRYLCLCAAILGFVYILYEKDECNTIALLLFILPFSSVFTVSDGTTSLFMFFRIACIIKLMLRHKMPRRYLCALVLFVGYSILSMIVGNTSGVFRIINMILWFLMGLSIIMFWDKSRMYCWARALACGTIYSGIVGLNLALIPNLRNSLIISAYKSTNSGVVLSRAAGLWNDPNGFTVFIIVSMFLCFHAFDSLQINGIELCIYEAALSVLGLLTLSKSCVLLMVVFWGYLFLLKSKMSSTCKIMFFFVGAVALIYVFFAMNDTIMTILSRFTSVSSLDSLTTGRVMLWKMYFEKMDVVTWIFGKGINVDLPNGRAAHNTVIQVIYNIGIVGSILWGSLFIEQYRFVNQKRENAKRMWIPILSLFATMMFLDGLFIEQYYILIPVLLCMSFSLSDKKRQIVI